MTKKQAMELADRLITTSIESGAWVKTDRRFNKANKLDTIELTISIKVESNKGG